MKIGIVGGTGDMGRGLATRFAARNQVIIGSRSKEKGEASASQLKAHLGGGEITGGTNAEAALNCDLVVLAVPDLPETSFLEELRTSLEGKIVISPIVPMTLENGMMKHAMKEGSAAEQVASVLRDSRVVAAFQNLPSFTLRQKDRRIGFDVLVACDRKEDYDVVAELIRSVDGLRPLYVGPLAMARGVEEITPILVNAAKLNGQKRLSIRLVD